ncbi:PH domain-containing protein [Nonomuraea lactucae]|uniref:PH domain-containing protein n=1 Tax=Nonomuraea lactucae TaxID=2249762 RepID=UPI0013B414DF|nr:PH domain-containing protein [Nonomuraea lactucae]
MKQTYRSRFAFVLGWAWVAFVAFNVWDLIVRYNGKPSLVALAVLGALTAVVYLIALRPATVFTEDRLVVRNPLRTTLVPWASIDGVTVSHSINVRHGDGRLLRLWTPVSTARERAKAQRRGAPVPRRGRLRTEPALSKAEQAAAEAFAGKTHADWVGEQITDRAESARRRSAEAAPAQVRWAIDSFAVLAAAAAMVAAAIVIG